MNKLDIILLKEVYKKSNLEIIDVIENNKNISMFKDDYEEKKEVIKNNLKKVPNLKIISYWDEEYSEKLKKISDPPVILYCLGNLNLFKTNSVSIVGTRKPSSYGRELTKNICSVLKDYTIVSGLAFGIDSISHQNAENTIAVLGCGIDIIYPKSNYDLYNSIKEKGLIISEYFPGTPPMKHTFPYRNRIIAGLSEKTIIVEAAKKSGSLITARYAFEYSRDVLALPGDITRINSQGTNYLIYLGATPIYSLDLLRDLFFEDNVLIQNTKKLNDFEKKIFNLIKLEKNNIEILCEELDEDTSEILTVLMQMQIKAVIKEIDGFYYINN